MFGLGMCVCPEMLCLTHKIIKTKDKLLEKHISFRSCFHTVYTRKSKDKKCHRPHLTFVCVCVCVDNFWFRNV